MDFSIDKALETIRERLNGHKNNKSMIEFTNLVVDDLKEKIKENPSFGEWLVANSIKVTIMEMAKHEERKKDLNTEDSDFAELAKEMASEEEIKMMNQSGLDILLEQYVNDTDLGKSVKEDKHTV